MSKNWRELVQESPEQKFDYRLAEKKIAEKFLTHQDVQSFKKSIPEEAEFDFTSHDAIEAEQPEETL